MFSAELRYFSWKQMIPFNFLDTRGKINFLLELSKVSCSHYHLHTLEGMSNPNRQVQIYFLRENQAVKANVTATWTRYGEIICLKMKRTQPQSFLSIWQNLSKDGIDQGKFVLITVALISLLNCLQVQFFRFVRSFVRSLVRVLARACARSLAHSSTTVRSRHDQCWVILLCHGPTFR